VTGSVVTIGNFDGVHLGHRALVDRTVERARTLDLRPVALTFDPHPTAVLRPDAVPLALQSLDERVAMLRTLGIDHVEVVRFDAELAARTPEEFVTDILAARLDARSVVVGENFRFGRGAAGDVAMLARLGGTLGFDVDAVTLVGGDGAAWSSSALRGLLAAGDLDGVAAGLGRPFSLTGEVVHGAGRGRTIGVPTANVAIAPGRALPADGVYACVATAGEGRWPAVVNIGVRPTFDGVGRTVEAHLLDADVDLYGRPLTLTFVARIRGEQRFDGPEALVARIRTDIAEAREALADVR
jgi:riboflavin kinase/FMN adenylyltransferase